MKNWYIYIRRRDTPHAVIKIECDNYPSKDIYTKTYNCFRCSKLIEWYIFIENDTIQEIYSIKTYERTMATSEINHEPLF